MKTKMIDSDDREINKTRQISYELSNN